MIHLPRLVLPSPDVTPLSDTRREGRGLTFNPGLSQPLVPGLPAWFRLAPQSTDRRNA
jgi:hypothetical protein